MTVMYRFDYIVVKQFLVDVKLLMSYKFQNLYNDILTIKIINKFYK